MRKMYSRLWYNNIIYNSKIIFLILKLKFNNILCNHLNKRFTLRLDKYLIPHQLIYYKMIQI